MRPCRSYPLPSRSFHAFFLTNSGCTSVIWSLLWSRYLGSLLLLRPDAPWWWRQSSSPVCFPTEPPAPLKPPPSRTFLSLSSLGTQSRLRSHEPRSSAKSFTYIRHSFSRQAIPPSVKIRLFVAAAVGMATHLFFIGLTNASHCMVSCIMRPYCG